MCATFNEIGWQSRRVVCQNGNFGSRRDKKIGFAIRVGGNDNLSSMRFVSRCDECGMGNSGFVCLRTENVNAKITTASTIIINVVSCELEKAMF